MPTPQINLLFVEQAGKPVLENPEISRAGRMPTPQINLLFVEQAGKPVHKI